MYVNNGIWKKQKDILLMNYSLQNKEGEGFFSLMVLKISPISRAQTSLEMNERSVMRLYDDKLVLSMSIQFAFISKRTKAL